MIYAFLILAIVILTIYVGILNTSIKTYRNLEQGAKVFYRGKYDGNDEDYIETSVSVDSMGNKYVTYNNSKLLFTKWDVIRGDVLTEEEYYYVFDF